MTDENSRFAGLDRKASALAEFTIRQYRTKLSTWVVMGVGMLAILMVLLFLGNSLFKEGYIFMYGKA